MKNLIKRIKYHRKMKRLNDSLEYLFGKMKEHEKDKSSDEWKKYAKAVSVYLFAMEMERLSFIEEMNRK